jgi:hypothetical protein
VSKSTFLLCVALAFTACAESRYHSNLQNAALTRWTHISRADYEQVVRLVSDSTHQPIIGITVAPPKSRKTRLYVVTGYEDSALQGWTGFRLEKRADGWHILSSGEISHFVAGMILSSPD